MRVCFGVLVQAQRRRPRSPLVPPASTPLGEPGVETGARAGERALSMGRVLRKLRTAFRRLSVSPDALEQAGSRSRDAGASTIGPDSMYPPNYVRSYDEGRPRK
jgi:hypothetical protein